jgi:tetratricopeptide (TPR) repeat protein
MTGITQTLAKEWPVERALILAVVCVSVGIAGGWFIHGGQTLAPSGSAHTASAAPPAGNSAAPVSQAPNPAQLKSMADSQAAPLLERLKSDSNNPDLLAAIGNIYYDAQQYQASIDYYGRVLNAKPSDAAVRTDMATAYWFMGNADTAIAEFNKALTYAPNNPNTLFNLGIVKWQGKHDVAGAEADWKKLLAANPKYEGRDKVEQMMNEAKSQAAAKPPMNAK